ncbi:MAG TPA: oligopeptide:H+ symporter [Gammaproteobacteria bacterium]|nr:oligopeptide:H+ symporter [Gammaproteobacteria bacterium]
MELFKHPKALWVLAFGKLWDTFSYYGTQTILVLYFMHIFKLPRSESILLYGAYAAFTYAIPIMGGVLGDKWLGSRNTLLLGAVLNIAGNLLLISYNRYFFCLGLAASLVGSGLYKGTATHMVGTLYAAGETRKEAGYTWLYFAVNVGGSLGPLVYGFMIYAVGWSAGFLCSAIGLALGLCWFIFNWQTYEDKQHQPNISHVGVELTYLALLVGSVLLSLTFYYPASLNTVVGLFFVGSIGYILIMIIKYQSAMRQRLLALLIMSFFGMFYFAAGMQIGTSITLFLQLKIQQGVIHTQLPASTFSTLYCLFVLLLAPVITGLWFWLRARGIQLLIINKLAVGIFLGALGIACFAFAAATNWIAVGLILGILLLSAGEVVIAPAIYTAISDIAPQGLKTTMMGCWFLFIGMGGYVSSLLAKFSDKVGKFLPFKSVAYVNEFLFITGFIVLVVGCLVLLIPRLKRMLGIGG